MKYSVLILLGCVCCLSSIAQPGTTIELKKTGKYENRTLPSEKSDTKKFGPVRHAYQNMVTHFNYYYNGNNRLNEIIASAKAAHRDDYTKLLSFYNYDLDATAQSSSDIDSIIYHCTAGVLLHDLRNDWIDNLYFLLGKAYYYRKNFDSALAAFQYINYAWAPKDEGYDLPIGSNETNVNGVFSIATKEKTGVLRKTIVEPPTRNLNFLWLSRTNIETGNTSRAAGLLQILRHDPNFPDRLQNNLTENLAYLYYNQQKYDSAAFFLSKSLDNASNRFERARWEYLIAQMYALSGNNEEAVNYFEKSANHTPDPIMEVNAYLNSITIGNDSTGTTTQQKLNSLLKLAKKDKYLLHRDIIYYAAAQVELQLGDKEAAQQLLKKSISTSVDNAEQKSLSFLLLADLSYQDKEWIKAHNFYDSTQASYIQDSSAMVRLSTRQPALTSIAQNLMSIDKEDSLQQVAAMPEAQRTSYLKKSLRQIRRSQGLSEEDAGANYNPSVQLQTQAELFNNTASASDWYFNNNSLKSSGYSEFRQRWGNRQNVDNWRRQAAVNQAMLAQQQGAGGDVDKDNTEALNGMQDVTNSVAGIPNSIEDLEAGLPLTEEKMAESNNNIAKALFASGEVFQGELQNYAAAIDMYQEMNRRTDSSEYREPSLLNLYYCYTKLGDKYRADSALAMLKRDYPKGKSLATLLNRGKQIPETSSSNPATQQYENIYKLFIEGNFDEAKKQKAIADSLYGNSYWTPQLLFIESVYYVSTRKDSTAIDRLQNLQSQFASSPLADKAATMISVLRRRAQIENYLTNLQITRNEDTVSTAIVNLNPVETTVSKPAPKKLDSVVTAAPVVNQPSVKTDTVAVKPVVTVKTFSYNAADPQFVALLLDKVAPVFATEARNAFNRYNKEKYYNMPQLTANGVKLDDRYNLVLIGPFPDALGALDYIDKTRPQTAGKILPWLTPDKFSYLMISQANLDLLKDNKDVEGYRSLIQKALPGKF